MRKKILGVALMAALIMSSIGTFTSCKDYDDDIDALNDRVTKVEGAIKELNDKFGALAYVKSVTFNNGVLTVTDQAGTATTYTIPNDADTNTTYTLDVKLDGKKIIVTLTDQAGKVQEKSITLPEGAAPFDPSKLIVKDGKIVYGDVPTGVELPKQEVSIAEIIVDGEIVGYTIAGPTGETTLMINDALAISSISFEPDLIYAGVPAMRALSVIYNPWSAIKECDPATATGASWKKATTNAFITPVIAGNYILNPSSATAEQIEKIEVVSRDIEYTKSAASKPAVEKYEVKDGVLTVYFSANAEDIKSIDDDGEITGFKIKVTTKAGTSILDQDYRAVYTSQYKNLILGDKAKKAKVPAVAHHLYGTTTGLAKEAIDAEADYKVEYDSKKGIDLKPLVITCYDDVKSPTATDADKTMTASELERLGLHYEFHLCAYLEGSNNTNQSDFARVEDGVLFPKLFNETATPYAAVGRKPLVRVQLLTADKKVVSTGWIKVEIVKGLTPAIDVPFEFGEFTNQCDAKDFTLTVEQMNVKIYNALGLNRVEFNALYNIKTVNNLAGTSNYGNGDGIVTLKEDNTNPTVTDLLSWNITQADMAVALARTTKTGELTTTVVYEPIDGTTRENVTVTFTVKVKPITGVTIDNKIAQYWDANFEYIRLNVAVPEVGDDNAANCTFVVDLDNVWVGNKPNIAGVNTYHYIFADKNKGVVVNGLSGSKYTLSLSTDNLQLLAKTGTATPELVAVIDETSGEVTYQETATAKDLLNIASHTAVPNGGFFAWINVKATTGGCDLELPISNGLFKAYFFRPIDVTGGEGKFIDAVDGGSKVNLLDLLSFNDWRDYIFNTEKNVNYFGYYGITAITVDIPNITTDLNGKDINTTLLTSITDQLVITQQPGDLTTDPKFGTITYKNNGNAVGAFNLRLPVTVDYKWGTVKAYVKVPVAKTEGN